MFFVRKDSLNEVESNIGLIYGSPNGTQSVEIDTLEELIEFIKEAKAPIRIVSDLYRPLITILDEE